MSVDSAASREHMTASAQESGLVFRLSEGRLHVAAAGVERVEVRGAAVAVGVRRGARAVSLPAERLEEEGTGWSASWPESGLRMQLRLQAVGGALLLHATLENRGAVPLALEEATPLYVGAPGEVRVGAGADPLVRVSATATSRGVARGTYRRRRGGCQPLVALSAYDLRQNDVRHRAYRGRARSAPTCSRRIKNLHSAGEALCLGFMRSGEAFGAVAVETGKEGFRSLRASLDLDGVELQPGERLALAPLWISAGFDEHALLAAYAAALGARDRRPGEGSGVAGRLVLVVLLLRSRPAKRDVLRNARVPRRAAAAPTLRLRV